MMTVDDEDAGTISPYFMSGTLKGYLWIAQAGTGTTLTATGFNVPQFTAPICISGSVAATPDNSGSAMLGFNLNQAMDTAPMAFTPTLGGLQVGVTNRAGSPLRIQIQTPEGAAVPGRWCVNVIGSGGFIPWTDFNTACWDGSGTAYAREPIDLAILQVPGGTDAPIPYDVCLNAITEMAAPAAPPPPPAASTNPT